MADLNDVFHVPASEKDKPENKFRFAIPGKSTVYELPLLKYLKPSLATDLGNLDEGAFMLKFINEYLPEAFGRLEDTVQLEALFDAWADASGVSLGESPASQELSPSEAEQSATS